ncbi:MAG TPA: M48 family peptidase, partial [Flavobacterium sp.]|nr:M48 family peptidase [Flavobacterium sp.]
MAQALLYLLIGFIVFEFILTRLLDYLNLKTWRRTLPPELKPFYNEEKYHRAQQYEKAGKSLSLVSGSLSFVIIIALLCFGGFGRLDEFVRQFTGHPVLMALHFFGIIFIVSEIIGLPFSLYSTFVIEEKFGFNRTTPKTFLLDKIKGYALTIILGGGLLSLLIFFY